jgi:hypothetical protein
MVVGHGCNLRLESPGKNLSRKIWNFPVVWTALGSVEESLR